LRSFWARGTHLGRAWDLMWDPNGKSCEKVAKCGLKMGGFGVLGVPLERTGVPFCGHGQQKKRQEVLKRRFRGHLENIDIPMCFWCFQRLATPNGAPNDGLEDSWGELGAHGGHFWDIWAPSWFRVCFEIDLWRTCSR